MAVFPAPALRFKLESCSFHPRSTRMTLYARCLTLFQARADLHEFGHEFDSKWSNHYA